MENFIGGCIFSPVVKMHDFHQILKGGCGLKKDKNNYTRACGQGQDSFCGSSINSHSVNSAHIKETPAELPIWRWAHGGHKDERHGLKQSESSGPETQTK